MSEIQAVHARQIVDSRGNPTVEVDVVLASGAAGRAAVPSGASTGEFEAVELRDGGDGLGRQGRGPRRGSRERRDRRAREGPRRRRPGGAGPRDDRARRHAQQGAAGRQRDPRRVARRPPRRPPPRPGLPLWRYLGGEAAHVLPVPMMNVLNGGAHADNKVDFQEFMVVPLGAASFGEALRTGAEVFHALKGIAPRPRAGHRGGRRGRLRARPRLERGRARGAGGRHRGGRLQARRRRGDRARPRHQRALRATASYVLEHEGRTLSAAELAAYWADVAGRYPDPLDRGRHGRGGLGRLEARSPSGSATGCSWWATTCS